MESKKVKKQYLFVHSVSQQILFRLKEVCLEQPRKAERDGRAKNEADKSSLKVKAILIKGPLTEACLGWQQDSKWGFSVPLPVLDLLCSSSLCGSTC